MDAAVTVFVILALGAGAIAHSLWWRTEEKSRDKDRKITYYRRLFTDLANARRHFEAKRPALAGLLDMDDAVAQRQLLEDAKFASRGLVTYELSDAHQITEAEAGRLLDLTAALKAADSTIEAAQEAAMAGSNTLPALHQDLMRRVDHIVTESESLNKRFRPKTLDFYWSD